MAKFTKKTVNTDVLIVGGGMTGSCLAIALASVGIKSVIVDKIDQKQQTNEIFDGRASALASASVKMLEKIGVWEHLSQRTCPILDIRVSDNNSHLFLHYDHQDVGDGPLGFMAENKDFRGAVFSRMKDLNNIYYCAPVVLEHVNRTRNSVKAFLNNKLEINASAMVGADGRNSAIRANAEIGITKWNYNQIAIVLTVEHELAHNNIAHEHFLPGGPFAILPLLGEKNLNNRSSIVWVEKSKLANSILALSQDDFADAFSQRFGDFLGKTTNLSPRTAFPLSFQCAETSIANRLALIGDAAHGMHPIAGQGLNMGLRDVAALAQVFADSRRLGLDIGSMQVLEDYENWRNFDNMLMLAMTDSLNRLFSNDVLIIKTLRDIGLASINKVRPLKKYLMRQAMGSISNSPRLLKGEIL